MAELSIAQSRLSYGGTKSDQKTNIIQAQV